MQKEIEHYEKKQQSWIIQGFPRTKVQALSLQSMKVIPDKIMNLNIRKSACVARIKNNIQNIEPSFSYQGEGDELADQIALKAYQEYEMHLKGVCEIFNQFVYQYEGADKPLNDISNDLARMLRVRFRNNAPRRPPKVILLGPPGSGKTTQA